MNRKWINGFIKIVNNGGLSAHVNASVGKKMVQDYRITGKLCTQIQT